MVSQYGPDVPRDILHKLVSAFAELREMADEGRISYPYSTREVVNIVKHLQVGYDTRSMIETCNTCSTYSFFILIVYTCTCFLLCLHLHTHTHTHCLFMYLYTHYNL